MAMSYTQHSNMSKRAVLAMCALRAVFVRSWLRFFGPRWTVGCMALLRDEQGRICLLKHRGRLKPWGLPGGLIVWPEAPEQGLRRELAEELRWSLPEAGVNRVGFALRSSCVGERFSILELVYEASRAVTAAECHSWIAQKSEILEIGWFSADQIECLDGLLERHRSLLLSVLRGA